jgi:hypothetical protein
VVGAPSLRLAQNPKTPTDIQTASDCALCDIPTTFQDTHRLITHTEYYVGQVAQVTLLLIVGGYFVSHIVRRKG